MLKQHYVLAVVVVSVAFLFRFHHLDSIPPGLFMDEAVEGNQALEAATTGRLQLFYSENNGREGLFVWLAAIPMKMFGNRPWALRSVSATFGVLTVVGLYLLAQQVFSAEIAAISSFLLATSFWHTTFSRLGLRAILAPFFVVWGFYFLMRAFNSGRLRDYAISGLAWGLGFYSYLAFRVMPLALAITFVLYAASSLRRSRWGLCVFGVVAAVVVLPLAAHFYAYPSDFFSRTEQLSLWSVENPVAVLASNLEKTLLMFNYRGDANWRHNVSGSATLPLIIGLFFIVGLVCAVSHTVRGKRGQECFNSAAWLLTWFVVGLLPAVLSNAGAPHSLRAIIAAPATYLLSAVGISWAYEQLRNRCPVRWSMTFLVVVLLVTMLSERQKYFVEWAKNPAVAFFFNERDVAFSKWLLGLPEKPKYIYINGKLSDKAADELMPVQTIMFITDTYTKEKQNAKKIHYVSAVNRAEIPPDSLLINLYQ